MLFRSEAYGNLGNALCEKGHHDEAIAAYRQAIALKPKSHATHNNLGNALRAKGRLDEAIAAYRQASRLKPDYPEAHNNLGIALSDQGCLDEAIASYRQAIVLRHQYPEAHSNLGNALRNQGRFDEAVTAYRQAIALQPNYAQAYYNLGNTLRDQGQLDEAMAAYRQAITLHPSYAEAHNNLGNVLRDQGQLDEALAAYRQAITLLPSYAEAHNNLGNVLRDQGQLDEAMAAYRQAIALKPNYPAPYGNLGNVLKDQGQFDAAIAAFRQAIELKPDSPGAHSNLGNALRAKGNLDEALAAHRQAITCQPDFYAAHVNLGNILKDQGQLDEALAAYRTALELKPDFVAADSNLVYTLHFHPDYDAQGIYQEHRRWNRQHAGALKQFIRPHPNDRQPHRRLRIGYLSPDFRQHPIGRFLLPLLSHHDKDQVEVFAYAQVPVSDVLTTRLRSYTDCWRSITGLSDTQTCELIRQDRIDILVDLTMHMDQNRLLVFAQKPAPVQVTYLAYCSTTGLDTIDYRLSDPYLDPPGMDELVYSEQTIRLPDTYWCYESSLAPAELNPLPAVETRGGGKVTYGCLNNFCKVGASTLTTWGRLMRAVPNSQLLLHARQGSHCQRVRDLLEREGIAPARVQFAGMIPIAQYFDLYRRIDIALDTFPYGGGTTTCDALWMGVPVVSLVGQTGVGRGGLSILSNIGLPELAAHTPAQYVQIAAALANDLPRLASLRSSLRPRMLESPLMDGPRFARNVEAAYRTMWRTWCEKTG